MIARYIIDGLTNLTRDTMNQTSSPRVKGIFAGLLPLKLNTGADRREIDRAKLLVRSLRRFWSGDVAFQLHIIGRNDEVGEIRDLLIVNNLPAAAENDTIHIIVHPEGELFPEGSPFFSADGMYKQQLIKLFAPVKLGLDAFITFDADIICIQSFDGGSFISNDKMISTWETRKIHSWWQNSMVGLRAWSDSEPPGMGVTPNTLHADICSQILQYLELRGLDPLSHLCDLTVNHPKLTSIDGEGIPLAWSEYSLYTIVGEWFGSLWDYHLTPTEVDATKVQLHSRRNVWSKDDVGRLDSREEDPGYFLVVQSWAGVSVEEIEARLYL